MRRLLPAVLGIALLAFAPALPAAADSTITPQIQLAAASQLSYDNQSTTVTGTVTDQNSQPVVGQPVQVHCDSACTDFIANTDANGQFTVPVTAQGPQMDVVASIAATSTVASASATLPLSAYTPTRIVPWGVPASYLSLPSLVDFSGWLQYQGADGTWKPLPSRSILEQGPGGSVNTEPTGNPDGGFSVALFPPAGSATSSVQVDLQFSPSSTVDQTFFGSGATATVTIPIIPATVTFSAFQATANADGTVTVNDLLTNNPDIGIWLTVQVEYSADGISGWQPLGSPQSGWDPLYGGVTFNAPLPTAFYRAVVEPGTENSGATSPVVEAGRTVTRVSGFKVSAAKVKVGHSFKITGTLQRDVSGSWQALAGQQVWILLQPKGSSTWYWYSKPVTSSSGAFSATIKVVKGMPTARWIPAFQGADGYYASAPANPKLVTVH